MVDLLILVLVTPDQARALHDRSWRAAPLFLEKACPDGLFSPQELFDIFLSAREGAGPGAIYFNWELEPGVFSRQNGAPTPLQHMPSTGDGSFCGYAERIRDLCAGGKFCLRLNEVHAYSQDVWQRCRSFLKPLAERFREAEPPASVLTTVLLGDYDFTPIGVHVDPFTQIQVAITGSRTALFWENSYWANLGKQDRLQPVLHTQAALQVPMQAGDAVYWQIGQEHAFSSSKGFSIAITFSFQSAEQAARHRPAHDYKLDLRRL